MLKGGEAELGQDVSRSSSTRASSCELCVQVCPTDAIIMLKTFDLATADRREMLLDKDRLHALGLETRPRGDGHRLRDMQAPPKAVKTEAKVEAGGKAESQGAGRVTAEAVAFVGVAVVLLGSSLAVVLTPNLFHSILYLAVALVATASCSCCSTRPSCSASAAPLRGRGG